MEKRNLELVVGTFVFFGFVILFILIFFVSGVFLFKQGYHVNIQFKSVIGIASGAPVKLAGVQVGQVEEVKIRYNSVTGMPEVVLQCFVDKEVQIRERSKVYLRGTFALSEPHVNIETASFDEGNLLKDGDTIVGIDPVRSEELIERGKEISYKLEELVVNANAIITDPKLKESVKKAATDFADLIAVLKEIFTSSEKDIKGVTRNMNTTFERMNSLLVELEQGKGSAGKFLKESTLYDEAVEFIRDLKARPWRLLQKEGEKKKSFVLF